LTEEGSNDHALQESDAKSDWRPAGFTSGMRSLLDAAHKTCVPILPVRAALMMASTAAFGQFIAITVRFHLGRKSTTYSRRGNARMPFWRPSFDFRTSAGEANFDARHLVRLKWFDNA